MNIILLIYILNFNAFETELKNINPVFKQGIKGDTILNPVQWQVSHKKLKGNEFEITYSVSITDGWFITAEDNPKDGFIPITFDFDDKQNIKVDLPKSPIKSVEMSRKLTEIMDNKVQLGYKNKAEFKHIIRVIDNHKKTKLKILIEYQCVTNEVALPPVEKTFTFEIKNGQLILLK